LPFYFCLLFAFLLLPFALKTCILFGAKTKTTADCVLSHSPAFIYFNKLCSQKKSKSFAKNKIARVFQLDA